MEPRILTTITGSYPLPTWLAAHPTSEALNDAIAMVLHTQELAGIDLPTDGELNRFDPDHPQSNGMVEYFIRRLRNVRTDISRTEEKMFRIDAEMDFRAKAAGVVEGQLGEGTLNLPADFQRTRALAAGPLKFAVTSPYMLARTLVNRHYKTVQALAIAIADVLAAQIAELDVEVVQVDDEILSGSPEDISWAIEPISRILGAARHKAALRVAFGNYNGQQTRSGTYAPFVEVFNQLPLDHILLECACRKPDELSCFKDLKTEIGIGVGVIDVKRNAIETPEDVARIIERAAKMLGPGRLRYVHPDNGLYMLRRTIVDAKLAALVQGRDLFEGRNAR